MSDKEDLIVVARIAKVAGYAAKWLRICGRIFLIASRNSRRLWRCRRMDLFDLCKLKNNGFTVIGWC